MDLLDFATALIVENAALAELFRDADLATQVPTCPEWTLDQLMRHVGRGDRWCAQIVAEQSSEFIDPRTVSDGKPPADRDGMIAWLHDGPRRLIAAVGQVGSETPVWTFLGPRPAAWWIRRRLHETAVHRADAAIAVGVPFLIDPAVAADAITEYLERVVIRAARNSEPPLQDGHSLHLHAVDVPFGEWTVVGGPDGIALAQEHRDATLALKGPARDLLLAIVRRGDPLQLGLGVFGDRAVWTPWLERTPF